ncbi:hypothetical protein WK91_12305 [Burkholderia cepacia]|nr:hypothetical protein WK91_12305 [Burkholderia cepacia]
MTREAGCVPACFVTPEAFASTRRRCAPAVLIAIRTNPALAGFAHSGRDAVRAFVQNRIDA